MIEVLTAQPVRQGSGFIEPVGLTEVRGLPRDQALAYVRESNPGYAVEQDPLQRGKAVEEAFDLDAVWLPGSPESWAERLGVDGYAVPASTASKA